MPESPTNNQPVETQSKQEERIPPGRILALDLGTKRVGVAVTDEMQLTVRPLPFLTRSNWKQLLLDLCELCRRFDVKTIVVGLPLKLDGTLGTAALKTRRLARNLSLSLSIPVHLQDERYTSFDAENRLKANRLRGDEILRNIDGEAAALILNDFINIIRADHRTSVKDL